MSFPSPPPLPHELGSYCQGCQTLAPTKYVTFYRHIGAIILMFNQNIKGRFCRSCANDYFAKTTLVTVFAGWWGIISFFITPCVLLHNVIRYLFCLSLKPAENQSARGTALAFVTLIFAVAALSLIAFLVVQIIQAEPTRR